jgi:hypothetical protein
MKDEGEKKSAIKMSAKEELNKPRIVFDLIRIGYSGDVF